MCVIRFVRRKGECEGSVGRVEAFAHHAVWVVEYADHVGHLPVGPRGLAYCKLHVRVGAELRRCCDEIERWFSPPVLSDFVEDERHARALVRHPTLKERGALTVSPVSEPHATDPRRPRIAIWSSEV